jgi:hypothetical protein
MKDTQRPSEPALNILSEHTTDPSGWIVLECSRCREELILLGLDADWPKEHSDTFKCSRCGYTVTLAHRKKKTPRLSREETERSAGPAYSKPHCA